MGDHALALLAQSLDVELTLALIPQLVVPRLGRWAAVHTVDAFGNLRLDGKSDWVRASSVIALERTEPDGRPALEVPSARD